MHKILWIGYLLVLIVLSLVPVHLPDGPEDSDKIMHLAAYMLVVLLWPRSWLRSNWAMFCFATGLGLVLECGQGVLPTGRFMEVRDVLANSLGASLGLGGQWVLHRCFFSGRFAVGRRDA